MKKGLIQIMHKHLREYKDIEAAQDDMFIPFGEIYNIANEISSRFGRLVMEKIAEYAHTAWAGWMNYLFEKSIFNDDGRSEEHTSELQSH